MRRGWMLTTTATAILLVACSDDGAAPVRSTTSTASSTSTAATDATTTTAATQQSGDTLLVPDDFATIQGAVDAAQPGDLILVGPGTYREAVDVTTDGLTIRGLDRNTVVLDGNFELENGIRVLGAAGVTVENMTATNYTKNGFFWTGVKGFHGAYLTTYRTGEYGVYSYDATDGQFDHLYTAGSWDAGVYIGGCFPCNAVYTQSVAEYNAVGFSGTNAGGDLAVVQNVFRHNRIGMMPNSGTYELCYPQRQISIIGNEVYDNNQTEIASFGFAVLATGNGVLVSGGIQDVIERNLVYDHDMAGIALVPYLEYDPNDAQPTREEWTRTCAESRNEVPQDPGTPSYWNPYDNRVVGNVLDDNRVADLLVAEVGGDASGLGNCFADNTFTTSAPHLVEALAPCTGAGAGDWTDGAFDVRAWLNSLRQRAPDWKTADLPTLPTQPNMPDAATAPAHPADDMPAPLDLAAIPVPTRSDST